MGHSGQTVPKQYLANVKQEGQIKSHMCARGTQGETVPQASSARYPVNFRTKLVLKLPRVQSSLAERIRKGSNPKQWPTFQARVSPSPWSDGPTLHACTEMSHCPHTYIHHANYICLNVLLKGAFNARGVPRSEPCYRLSYRTTPALPHASICPFLSTQGESGLCRLARGSRTSSGNPVLWGKAVSGWGCPLPRKGP